MLGAIMLLVGVFLCIVTGSLAVASGQINIRDNRWFHTFSEMVSIWDEPQGRMWFSFSMIGLFLLFSSEYPFIMQFRDAENAPSWLSYMEETFLLVGIVCVVGCPIQLDRENEYCRSSSGSIDRNSVSPRSKRARSSGAGRVALGAEDHDLDDIHCEERGLTPAPARNTDSFDLMAELIDGGKLIVSWSHRIMFFLHMVGVVALFVGVPILEIIYIRSCAPKKIRETSICKTALTIAYTTGFAFAMMQVAVIFSYLYKGSVKGHDEQGNPVCENAVGCIPGPAPQWTCYLTFTLEIIVVFVDCSLLICRGYWGFNYPRHFRPAGMSF